MRLALRLTLDQLLHLALIGTAGLAVRPGLQRLFRIRLLARSPLGCFAFVFVLDMLRVHSSILIPAYFSTSFFKPCPGKLTVSLASSPSPSRLNTVPRPYFGCCTTEPAPNALLFAGDRNGTTTPWPFALPLPAGLPEGGLATTGVGPGGFAALPGP